MLSVSKHAGGMEVDASTALPRSLGATGSQREEA